MKSIEKRPKVGVGVVVVNEERLLLGKRKGSHGEGSWSFAGGHLEHGESLEECATRELFEETGLKALSLKRGPWVDNVIEDKHYITLFAIVEKFEGKLELLEPNKCEGWHWFNWHSLPTPLFPPVRSFMDLITRKLAIGTKDSFLEKLLTL